MTRAHENRVIEVVMLAVLRPAFEEWLATRDLILEQVPHESRRNVYIVVPRPDHPALPEPDTKERPAPPPRG